MSKQTCTPKRCINNQRAESSANKYIASLYICMQNDIVSFFHLQEERKTYTRKYIFQSSVTFFSFFDAPSLRFLSVYGSVLKIVGFLRLSVLIRSSKYTDSCLFQWWHVLKTSCGSACQFGLPLSFLEPVFSWSFVLSGCLRRLCEQLRNCESCFVSPFPWTYSLSRLSILLQTTVENRWGAFGEDGSTPLIMKVMTSFKYLWLRIPLLSLCEVDFCLFTVLSWRLSSLSTYC